jgi:hypothetical protein
MKKPKRPKKPKMSASPASWEGFEKRMKEWEKKCKDQEQSKRRKEAIMKKYR